MTELDTHEHRPRERFLYVVTGFAALGGLLFGYDTGVISGAMLFIREEFSLSAFMVEVITSAVLAGALLGAAIAGWLTDRHGRRIMLVLAGFLFVVGAISCGLAPSALVLGLSRLVVGVAIGVTSTVAPLYIAEVAPAQSRGGLVAVYQLAVTIGILASTLVDEALSTSGNWRWMLGLAALPGALQFFGMMFMPCTPRWLVSQNDLGTARRVLQRMIGVGADTEAALAEIQETLEGERSGTWSNLLSPSVRPALVIGVAMAVFQQITGINTVFYYAPTIFEQAGFHSPQLAIWASVVLSTVNVAATFVAIRYLDRVGRRPLLIAGLLGMVVSLVLLGGAFAVLEGEGGVVGVVAVVFLALYVACFAFSLGPIVWVLISEIFPLHVRGLAVSVATMANWAANFIVTLTFLSLIDAVGRPATFWLYGVAGVITVVFVLWRVPETKGQTLEEIERSWRRT